MSDCQKCAQLDQCSVCCMWVDLNAGAANAPCPACPYRTAFAESAADRRDDAERRAPSERAAD